MITTEGPYRPRSGYASDYIPNGNGGYIRKTGQPAPWDVTGGDGVLPLSYNVGFGSTVPTAAWIDLTAAQCERAGISTADMDPLKPDTTKKVEVNIPAANIATVRYYGDYKPRKPGFFELYESQDDRHARHAALRAAGYHPPFPRADRFYKNKHQKHVQVGLATSPSYGGS